MSAKPAIKPLNTSTALQQGHTLGFLLQSKQSELSSGLKSPQQGGQQPSSLYSDMLAGHKRNIKRQPILTGNSPLFTLCSIVKVQGTNHRRKCLLMVTSYPCVSWTLYSSAIQPELHISPSKLYLFAQGTHPNTIFPRKKDNVTTQKRSHLTSLQVHTEHFCLFSQRTT